MWIVYGVFAWRCVQWCYISWLHEKLTYVNDVAVLNNEDAEMTYEMNKPMKLQFP